MELQYLFERFPTLRLAVPLDEIQPVREAVAGAVATSPSSGSPADGVVTLDEFAHLAGGALRRVTDVPSRA
ncbi:MAG TPA: hypothetical protein VGO16_09070 [Pseudonocardiaceae bacterium]|nr:hypothetical protein [Pseudonocardiaceae bacterium]